MRVVLSTYDSRGGVEPLVALAVRFRDLRVRVCSHARNGPDVPRPCVRAAAVRSLVHDRRRRRGGRWPATLLLDAVSRDKLAVPG